MTRLPTFLAAGELLTPSAVSISLFFFHSSIYRFTSAPTRFCIVVFTRTFFLEVILDFTDILRIYIYYGAPQARSNKKVRYCTVFFVKIVSD